MLNITKIKFSVIINMENSKTKLSLAANYDSELIPELAKLSVDEVYGKLPSDGISGGRPHYMSSPLTKKKVCRLH